MTVNSKIDSNATGLRYAEEASPKTLPGTPVWIAQEPNSYSDFGGSLTTVPRNPINNSRQNKKGVVTDLDASGGYNTDLTQFNIQDLLQGFFFADLRKKGECKNAIGETTLTISVTAATDTFTRVGGTLDLTTQFEVDDLILTAGFANSENNGLFAVTAVTATTVVVALPDGAGGAATTVDESATSNGSIVQVGYEAAAGDIDVDMTGSRPALTSTTLNFTDLGLIVGESIFIGGDSAGLKFTNATNNGICRVRSIAAARLEFDKTAATMVTEASTTETIHLFIGRVLKNELASLIKRRTYHLERTLGKADTTDTYDQVEYLTGSTPNEMTINVSRNDKVTVDLSFVSMDHELKDGATGPKSGTRPALVEADAFNTSSDFSRIKLAVHNESDANPTALYAFGQEMTLVINNGITPDKAIAVLGAFDTSKANFSVGGDITAYFADVAAVSAVRNNSDLTLDMFLVKANAGINIDVPLITLGDGRLNVVQDQAIEIPLTNEAATGAKIDTNLDHTLLMTFFDYLPTLADV
jgi:hypothetical protein